jgi:hypothetical protein
MLNFSKIRDYFPSYKAAVFLGLIWVPIWMNLSEYVGLYVSSNLIVAQIQYFLYFMVGIGVPLFFSCFDMDYFSRRIKEEGLWKCGFCEKRDFDLFYFTGWARMGVVFVSTFVESLCLMLIKGFIYPSN